MPRDARANGLWHGPDPQELRILSYAECKVINLARVYVSLKRVFLDRSSYKPSRRSEAPLYHQKNVVAYPQNPDEALRSIGMSPQSLAKMIVVQFVGEDRQELRRNEDLTVSVQNLRGAFRWLSTNSWPFMDATKHHELWQTDLLDKPLEELLNAYVQSVGADSGVPCELLQGASRLDPARVAVNRCGPADCTATEEEDKDSESTLPESADMGQNCAAALDGGVDDLTPLQLWDCIMKKYKVAQICEQELRRLDAEKDGSQMEQLQRDQAIAVAAAVEALAKLQHQDTKKRLAAYAREQEDSKACLEIPHSKLFLSNRDPLFWFSCFVRLFPRGDCLERCPQRSTILPAWRWAKCLITRADFNLWRLDVEFIASLYNIFLRRDQVAAVEATLRSLSFSEGDRKALESLTAAGLVATALASGEVNSVRELLRKKGIDGTVRKALNKVHISQRTVRGSEAERDNLMPKFMAMRLWSGCASLFFTLNPHDLRSPITLTLLQNDHTFEKTFSLDVSDEEAAAFLADFLKDNPRRLHELVAGNPLAATRCFHWTVRLVLRTLFNCGDKPGSGLDSIAAHEVPGVFGHVRAFFGVVEPQMRKALHTHMLVYLLGFAHPDDLFADDALPGAIRRLWYFVASICFRSTEGFGNEQIPGLLNAWFGQTASVLFLPFQNRFRAFLCLSKLLSCPPMLVKTAFVLFRAF